MTINIPGDRSIAPSGSTETGGLSRAETSRARGAVTGSDDRISVSSTTTNINSALDEISASRASRVARLTQLYSSGRYAENAQTTAKALVSDADSVEIR